MRIFLHEDFAGLHAVTRKVLKPILHSCALIAYMDNMKPQILFTSRKTNGNTTVLIT